MKTIIIAAAALFAANVGAAGSYDLLVEGNPDSSTARKSSAEDFVGVQPGIGDSVDRYHGWADGNPDLFKSERSGPTDSGMDPDIYMDLGANPDLQF